MSAKLTTAEVTLVGSVGVRLYRMLTNPVKTKDGDYLNVRFYGATTESVRAVSPPININRSLSSSFGSEFNLDEFYLISDAILICVDMANIDWYTELVNWHQHVQDSIRGDDAVLVAAVIYASEETKDTAELHDLSFLHECYYITLDSLKIDWLFRTVYQRCRIRQQMYTVDLGTIELSSSSNQSLLLKEHNADSTVSKSSSDNTDSDCYCTIC
jgi:hypothetical protein